MKRNDQEIMMTMMVNDCTEDDGADDEDRDNMINDDPDGGRCSK